MEKHTTRRHSEASLYPETDAQGKTLSSKNCLNIICLLKDIPLEGRLI